MSILLHIIFAFLSIVITGVTAYAPTSRRLIGTYIAIVLTVASGVLLAALNHAMLARVCGSGVIFLAFETAGIAYSIHKLRKLSATGAVSGETN